MLNSELGQSCWSNYDCIGSSVCCSEGECQPSSLCLMGLKPLRDSCDFNYECQSRCCSVDSICGASCGFTELDLLFLATNHTKMDVAGEEKLKEKKQSEKKKKPKELWGLVILISFLVFIVSQFINVCISKM